MPANANPAPAATPAPTNPADAGTPAATSMAHLLEMVTALMAERQADREERRAESQSAREREAALREDLQAIRARELALREELQAIRARGADATAPYSAPNAALLNEEYNNSKESAVQWWRRMESKLNLFGETEERRRLAIFVANLRGSTASWAQSLTEGPDATVRTCAQLRERFFRHHGPLAGLQPGRDELYQLKQTGTVSDYAQEHRELAVHIKELSDDERRASFLQGLAPYIKKKREVRRAKTYDDLLQEALDVESVEDKPPPASKRGQTRPWSNRASSGAPASRGAATGSASTGHRPARPSPAASHTSGATTSAAPSCPNCGDRGHRGNDCPQRRGGQANSAAATADSELTELRAAVDRGEAAGYRLRDGLLYKEHATGDRLAHLKLVAPNGRKLAAPFVGPFTITAVRGTGAATLALPPSMGMNPTVNASPLSTCIRALRRAYAAWHRA
ncbi:hypothetical protein APUTEX25_003608 [Auxenochlorella protothecoides]|uniref:CCHC-type domain-containing protein n=1 Tax=Auxenochlorella protothecoides TaxID=3075 RepID=A0A3M7KNI9_AUXPR|nr:hypothetical protein APUTEX25_003608 [Auxenochlorella protothecoides]|eukprot:RMZ52121.1 hypothetical protein APUTEX25_003608 [Auxenochlorella protothecoides]